MNKIDVSFEQPSWEAALEKLGPNESISAAEFLALLENDDEEEMEAALAYLDSRHIALSISNLPKDIPVGADAQRLLQEQQLVQSGDLIGGLAPSDPLRLYLQEVALTPVAFDPAVLAARLIDGDESAGPLLADHMLAKVIESAKEAVGRGVFLLELIQEGSLGLWQAILQYTQGDIQTHCDWWIRQYIAKAVTLQARSNGTGQKLRRMMKDYRDVDEQLLIELGRNATPEEIAEHMHILPEEAIVVEQMLAAARTDEYLHADKTEQEVPEEEDQAVENTAYFQSRQRIMEMLSVLDKSDAQLLSLRFGLDGNLPMSPQEVGRKMHITTDEVIARETTALAKMRQK